MLVSGQNNLRTQVHLLLKRCVEVKVSPHSSQLHIGDRVRRDRPPRAVALFPDIFTTDR